MPMRIITGTQTGAGMKIALVVSRYHEFVTDRLREGALAALSAAGVAPVDITVVDVPGAFEVPFAARRAAVDGGIDAVVCLGCLIRGATAHFDLIAAAVAHGITAAASETGVPMAFGVLTTSSAEEALERAKDGPSNKGWEAAQAAVAMASIVAQLGGRRPVRPS
jgi:6,7-dimethyl-8-ribityllumazine synthase